MRGGRRIHSGAPCEETFKEELTFYCPAGRRAWATMVTSRTFPTQPPGSQEGWSERSVMNCSASRVSLPANTSQSTCALDEGEKALKSISLHYSSLKEVKSRICGR